MKPNLERDLIRSPIIEQKVQDDQYAEALYSALCNNEFIKDGEKWSCSWRSAGGVVASLRWKNEDYTYFYCAGNEGNITDEIRQDLKNLGWEEVCSDQ